MWQEQIAELRGAYHCLAPDLPEHGGSMAVTPFSIAGCAQQIADLIQERAQGGKAHVVGLSLGAQVAVALLAAAPERLHSALISSAMLRPAPGAWMYTPAMLKFTYQTCVAPFKNVNWWIDLNARYSSGIPERYYAYARADFQRMTEDAWLQVMSENLNFRLPAGLDKVKVPVLVMAGEGEYGAMKQSARELAAALPNARLELVQHARERWFGSPFSLAQQHNWNLNDPQRFTQRLRQWLENL